MRNKIYFTAFALLTLTDCIIGYNTAKTIFGIDSLAMSLIWAAGFSMMSIPLKLMYERVVEEPYSTGKWWGKLAYAGFCVVWLFIAYNAFSGMSELRKTAMILDNNQVTTGFGDERTALRDYSNKQLESTSTSGFLYLNLLLILSAAICLNMALTDEDVDQQISGPDELNVTINDELAESIKNTGDVFAERASKTERVYHFRGVRDQQETRTGTIEHVSPAATVYRCKDCNREFGSSRAYNGHFRANTVCQKGNYEQIDKPYELKLNLDE